MQLRGNTEKTVVQSIQNEIVLVNLENGIYYFLTGSAAVIFSVLDAGCPSDKLLDALSGYYGAAVQGFKVDVASFVDQLVAESLLVEGVGSSGLIPDDFLSQPFVLPVLNKCEDLQDLLLLDPVFPGAAIDSQPGSA